MASSFVVALHLLALLAVLGCPPGAAARNLRGSADTSGHKSHQALRQGHTHRQQLAAPAVAAAPAAAVIAPPAEAPQLSHSHSPCISQALACARDDLCSSCVSSMYFGALDDWELESGSCHSALGMIQAAFPPWCDASVRGTALHAMTTCAIDAALAHRPCRAKPPGSPVLSEY
ncbi:hypothetical protein JKP88DRAFT_245194 [Tribonema minus]|uniref:Uncharacterized protein n=1 Tax=Tribonema minus TaxID=303371 RepID=A0A835YY43_9STRA|nr:hypothetical protein JKP88DRAFT_245194 [Tribonema minus]